MAEQRSLRRIITIGMLVVGGPFYLSLYGPLLVMVIAGASLEAIFRVEFYGMIACFVVGWPWWSFAAPRWRLWALPQVEDYALFHYLARKSGLEWRRGGLFERTEIRPRVYDLRIHAISARLFLRVLEAQLVDAPKYTPDPDGQMLAATRRVLNAMDADREALVEALPGLIERLWRAPGLLYDTSAQNLQSPLHQLLSEYLGLLQAGK